MLNLKQWLLLSSTLGVFQLLRCCRHLEYLDMMVKLEFFSYFYIVKSYKEGGWGQIG